MDSNMISEITEYEAHVCLESRKKRPFKVTVDSDSEVKVASTDGQDDVISITRCSLGEQCNQRFRGTWLEPFTESIS